MALYLYDSERASDMQEELATVRACKGLLVQGTSWKDFRRTLAMLVHHRVVVMPAALHQHTKLIETLKDIARLIPGMVIRPLCVHQAMYKRDNPNQPSAADTVVPPVQQRAVADGPIPGRQAQRQVAGMPSADGYRRLPLPAATTPAN